MEVRKKVRAERWPSMIRVSIVGVHKNSEGPLRDVSGTCLIAKEVTSPTEASAGAIAMAPEAAGTCPAENKDLCGAGGIPIDGFQGGDEVVGGGRGNVWPDSLDR